MANEAFADGFVQVCIDPSLNSLDGKCRVLVEGQYFNGGANVVADTLLHVTSPRDLDTQFGAGSQLAESLKKMFCTCPEGTDIYVLPRLDAAGSIAAEYTLTLTGPATTSGRYELYLGEGEYSVDVRVTEADTATTIAAAIVAAIPLNFPYTATAIAGVITFVAKSKGKSGNFLTIIPNWRNLQNYAPAGIASVIANTVVGSGDPLPLNYAKLLGTCCYTCIAILSGSDVVQDAWQRTIAGFWSCDTPQCFGQGYTYNAGNLTQVIASGTNAAELNRLAHCPDSDTFPWLKVAAYTALTCCTACDNPEKSIQGQTDGVLTCLRIPAGCSTCYTYDEQVQLKAAGFVVSGPLEGGFGTYTSPYIFNDVTNSLYDSLGKPNLTFRDTNSRRLAAKTAVAIAEQLQTYAGQALFTVNTTIKQGTAGTNPRLMLAGMRAWALSQVGVLFSEFEDINRDLTLRPDFETAPKCQGIPGKMNMFMRYRPPVRLGSISVKLQPKYLTNC